MTDRERFYNKAKANGLDVVLTATTVEYVAMDGKLLTVHHFDENGNYKRTTH